MMHAGILAEPVSVDATREAMDRMPGRRWCEKAQAALTKPRTVAILVGAGPASYFASEAMNALLGESPAAIAARLVSAMCVLLMDTSLWLSMDSRVLTMLAPRARYVRIMQGG